MPNKLLGQHFLKNRSVAQKMIEALGLARGDTVFEIGAGHGELTVPLVEAVQKIGGTIFAIEKDVSLAENLKIRLSGAGVDGVQIISGDALEFLKSRFAAGNSSAASNEPYKLVGNIPYYLTGHLLRTAGELDPLPARCVFTVQKEVAERIVAKPPKMNRLAASIQFWAEPKVIVSVPKESFFPAPTVDSAIIMLETKQQPKSDAARYYETMRTLFAQPRKTVLNNLSARKWEGTGAGTRMQKEKIAGALQKIGISPLLRPQNLTIENISAIAEAFFI
jgi:16S rRNA (adenine1518-N6/adenine1519-N6)-dimethyltransferase